MAIALDETTQVFTIPQGDLTLVSGTLYDVPTNDVRQDINSLMDDERYIWMEDPINHNTEVTVAGVTFARTIEFINGYSTTYSPDSQWTARLTGSNNNMFDVENGILNQNQVQVIAGNSAGLQTVTSGSGLSTEQDERLEQLWQDRGFDAANPVSVNESAGTISVAGTIRTWVGSAIKTLTRTT